MPFRWVHRRVDTGPQLHAMNALVDVDRPAVDDRFRRLPVSRAIAPELVTAGGDDPGHLGEEAVPPEVKADSAPAGNAVCSTSGGPVAVDEAAREPGRQKQGPPKGDCHPSDLVLRRKLIA